MAVDPRDKRYAFSVEWFDVQAQLNRPFTLFYFTIDDTIEMVTIASWRHFGASIVVFARQLKVVGYADDFTRGELDSRKEQSAPCTFLIIKPHCFDQCGKIIEMIEQQQLVLARLRSLRLTEDKIREGLAHLRQDPDFDALVASLAGDPCVAIEVVGTNAVRAALDLAERIRAKFGQSAQRNAVYVSATADNALREAEFFFSPTLPNTAVCTDCTLCCILPHAIAAGHGGAILNAVLEEGFEVSAIELARLDRACAAEFLEVYQTVVPEYTSTVDELSNGPCLVCEVRGENVVPAFREICGPVDPEVAKHIRPKSIRARWGENKVRNAVHCTDLPEDGVLECEYFFRILPQAAAPAS